jgi:YHS domain-containing protein
MMQPVPIPDHEELTVCGGKMEDPVDFPCAIFHGRRVYFCEPACLAAFEADPERFMAGEIEHPT